MTPASNANAAPEERILLSYPDVSDLEREALLRAFDSGWIAPLGPELNAFEDELSDYVGGQACAGLSSGTAGLQLALQLVGVKPGDEVVVQSATFAASAFAAVHAGARPIFCDSTADTWCLDPDALRSFFETRAAADRLPAAVMPVDLYGYVPDYAALVPLCAEFGVPIVEDAAEALGSLCEGGQHAGTFGAMGVYSFNGNKIMTTSGGGALIGDPERVAKARWLASQARENELWYEHLEIGFNFRMSNLLAAVGRAQLAGLEEKVKRRSEINAVYRERLPHLEWAPKGVTERPNNWLSVALLPERAGAATALGSSVEPDTRHDPMALCVVLNQRGIEARPFWKPMHQQPVFADCEMIGGGVSDDLFRRGICLPSASAMTDPQHERVIVALAELTA